MPGGADTIEAKLGRIAQMDDVEARAKSSYALTQEFPAHSKAWLAFCRAEMERKCYSTALDALDNAVQTEGDYLNKRQIVLAELHRIDAASPNVQIAAYERFLRLMPDHTTLAVNLAEVLAAVGKHDSARDVAKRAIAASPTFAPRLSPLLARLLHDGPRTTALPTLEVPDYRVDRVFDEDIERVLYEAVDARTGAQVTLCRLKQLPPNSARTLFHFQEPHGAHERIGLVPVRGTVDSRGGEPLLVLDRIRGQTVREAFSSVAWASRTRSVEQGLNLVWLVARALDRLYSTDNYIHGRISPSSVFCDFRPVPWFAILDTGSHAARLNNSTPLAHLADGVVPTHDADVLGLGQLLYYVLTGELPFKDSTKSVNQGSRYRVAEAQLPTPLRGPLAKLLESCLNSPHEMSAREIARHLTSMFEEPARVVSSGDTIGAWTLGRSLGSGSYGIVYEASNTISPQMSRAVKVLEATLAGNREMRFRFAQEACQGRAGLHHNAIVSVTEFEGVFESSPYFVMEMLRGKPMNEVIRYPVIPPLVIRWGVDIAGGLAYAHESGIAHRDVKPANLFVLDEPSKVLVKILDFGVAKVDDSGLETTHGVNLGTAMYRPADTSTPMAHDVYALGLVLLEALLGRFPTPADREGFSEDCMPSLDDSTRSGLARLVKEMVDERANKRPSMAEVHQQLLKLAHWLSEVATLVLPPPVASPTDNPPRSDDGPRSSPCSHLTPITISVAAPPMPVPPPMLVPPPVPATLPTPATIAADGPRSRPTSKVLPVLALTVFAGIAAIWTFNRLSSSSGSTNATAPGGRVDAAAVDAMVFPDAAAALEVDAAVPDTAAATDAAVMDEATPPDAAVRPAIRRSQQRKAVTNGLVDAGRLRYDDPIPIEEYGR